MEENETSTPAPETPADEAIMERPATEELPSEAIEQLLVESTELKPEDSGVAAELAVLEAIVYITDEPLSLQQIANALGKPVDHVKPLLDRIVAEYNRAEHGLMVREVAGGYKMATKPEHHEAVRAFVKNLNPPLKLSLAALETLAVIAYKQPITAPEIMEIRGVQGAGVLKTLIDRKLITTSGRKNVVGRPILYKTTKDFMVQFGLKDLNELPTLKEFEELRRLALGEEDIETAEQPAAADTPAPVRESETEEAAGEETPAAESTPAEPAAEEPAGEPTSAETEPRPEAPASEEPNV